VGVVPNWLAWTPPPRNWRSCAGNPPSASAECVDGIWVIRENTYLQVPPEISTDVIYIGDLNFNGSTNYTVIGNLTVEIRGTLLANGTITVVINNNLVRTYLAL